MITTTLMLIGVATWYTPTDFSDPVVLYCGYSEADTPWVALSVDLYETGAVRCGDAVVVEFPHGEVVEAKALDAGPLYKYYIEDYPDLPLLVDMPEVIWPLPVLSSPVTVTIQTRKEVPTRQDPCIGRDGLYLCP